MKTKIQDLKLQWEQDKNDLQNNRKKLADARDKLYQDYNDLKKGFSVVYGPLTEEAYKDPNIETKITGGTRAKQDRERAELYTQEDERLKESRSGNNPKQKWQNHYADKKRTRASIDADTAAKLNNRLKEIEQQFSEYKELVRQYHRDYYTVLQTPERSEYLDPSERSNYDAKYYQSYLDQTKNYQLQLEQQIEQDQLLADGVWESMLAEAKGMASKLQEHYKTLDKALAADRITSAKETLDYNNSYYANTRASRTKEDSSRLTWTKYRGNVKRSRGEKDAEFERIFSESFKEIAARFNYSIAAMIAEETKFNLEMSRLNKSFFGEILGIKNFAAINNYFLERIKRSWLAIKRHNSTAYSTLKKNYVSFKATYTANVNGINNRYNSADTYWRNQVRGVERYTTEVNVVPNIDARLESRREFYTRYATFIKEFFKTWDAAESTARLERQNNEKKSRADRIKSRKNFDIKLSSNRLADLEKSKKDRIEKARIGKYAVNQEGYTYDEDMANITLLRNNKYYFRAFQKSMGMNIRIGWNKFKAFISNAGIIFGIGARITGRVLADASIYSYYRLATIGSSAYFILRRGAYAAYITDYYVLRPFWHYIIVDSSRGIANVVKYIYKHGLRGLAAYMQRFFTNMLANLMRGIVLPLVFVPLRIGNAIVYIMKISAITLLYPLDIIASNLFFAVTVPALLLANMLSQIGYSLFRVVPGIIFLSIYSGIRFIALQTISVVANISYKMFVIPLQFILSGLAYLLNMTFIRAARAVTDVAVLAYLAVGNSIITVSRALYDIGHYAKQYLYDKLLVRAAQRIYDVAVKTSRVIRAAVTAIGLSITKFRFATYVAAKSLALRTSYAFGRMSNSAVYYSGNLVVKVQRFGSDRYKGASKVVSDVTIPAQEKFTKARHSAKYVIENAPTTAARFADDYIAYPITYAYHNAGVALHRAAWDGYINVWRGLQSVCTSGIRGFHDVVVDTKHVAATKASNFGSAAYDAATTAKQAATTAGYKTVGAMESLNVYDFFESGADKIAQELRAKKDESNRTNPTSPI